MWFLVLVARYRWPLAAETGPIMGTKYLVRKSPALRQHIAAILGSEDGRAQPRRVTSQLVLMVKTNGKAAGDWIRVARGDWNAPNQNLTSGMPAGDPPKVPSEFHAGRSLSRNIVDLWFAHLGGAS